MGIFSLATTTSNTTIGNACLGFNGVNIERIYILEITICLEAAPGAVSTFGLGAPAVEGQTQTYLAAASEDQGAIITDTFPLIRTSWTTMPTPPSTFLRQASVDNVVGSTIVWQFPEGLIVPSGSSMGIWNITNTGNSSITLTWDD